MTVKLLKYLRPEQRFDNMEALRQQILQDVKTLKNNELIKNT